VSAMEGADEKRQVMELEAQGEEVNGELVREFVERRQRTELIKTGLAAVAFAMQVVGLWGDGGMQRCCK
jgi:autophagy-related protein 33